MASNARAVNKTAIIHQNGNGSAAVVKELEGVLKGRVIRPESSEYEKARTIFYGGIDRRPAAVVKAADAFDITRVVNLAREAELELAIRSGGHSFAGFGLSNGGIVLDIREMRGIEIDPSGRTAWVETGSTAGEFTKQAANYGLAVGFGDTGSVGVGGITLGGGVGFLSRKYGLTIDSLLAAEMVTADGSILRVDPENHPDLFWAIRGGGGNFGVATRFLFRLHEVSQVVGGMLILPATAEVLASFIDAAEAAPEELSTIVNVMSAPPMPFLPAEVHGKLIIMALMAYAGNVEQGKEVLAPFRSLAQPLADMVRPISYPEMFFPEEEDYHPTAAARSMFMDRIDRSTAEMILSRLQRSDAPMRVAQLRVLGGAVARVPVDATAYAHRQARIMVNVAAFYQGQEDRPLREAWVTEFAADLNQGYPGVYVNFLGDEGQQRVRAAFPGTTWDRLVEVKSRYDPSNLFRVNHNIPPARK
jgi:FAD/FMN-containing dehydrogenase